MGRETLHWFRLLTPGVLAALAFISVAVPDLDGATIRGFVDDWEGVAILVFMAIGYPYRVLNVRKVFLGDFWESVDRTIESRLLEIVARRSTLTDAQVQYLRSDRHLMDVFYRVVDDDATLKNRTSGIYFNGYLTTLGVDFAVVAGLTAAVHLLFWVIRAQDEHLAWAVGLVVSSCVAYLILVKRSVQRHKDLSNEQLRFIANFHAASVCESVQSILLGMPMDAAK